VRAFRAASLIAAPVVAWWALRAPRHPDALTHAVTYVAGPLWALITLALLVRVTKGGRRRAQRGALTRELGALDLLEVLTAKGTGTLWISVAALVASAHVGWASLAVLGVLGLGLVELTAAWTLLRAGGDDPVRVASVARRFTPSTVTEGESVTEEVALSGARIPLGFRLFVSGAVGPRWPATRYTADAELGGGEAILRSDLGPAYRGDHHAPALSVWLGDVLGLCRSVRRLAAPATLTVLPRVRAVEGVRDMRSAGGQAEATRQAQRLPTEGSMRLREYQQGDDARRIHWARSLGARQVVVRLPDELPPQKPGVRLVLDTFLPSDSAKGPLSCDAHHELLDALVRVWLGVARALAERGARVTLVTAAPANGDAEVAARSLPMATRAQAAALKLGAEVRWQEDVGVEDLVADGRPAKAGRATLPDAHTVVVSYRLQPDPAGVGHPGQVEWIVVPRSLWAGFDDPVPPRPVALFTHPLGSSDNRRARRSAERARMGRMREDSDRLIDLSKPTRSREEYAGQLVATPAGSDRIRLEAL
jgi:uncharacterized protein (DUF58 family)